MTRRVLKSLLASRIEYMGLRVLSGSTLLKNIIKFQTQGEILAFQLFLRELIIISILLKLLGKVTDSIRQSTVVNKMANKS